MQVVRNSVVTFDYTLTDDTGAIIDQSEEGQPLAYLHGVGNIIPGLEKALEGKSAGERLSVTISPEEGYGERDQSLVQRVPRDRFDSDDSIEVGMHFHTPTDDGMQVVTVIEVDEEAVTVDANHPLAGVMLNFDVLVKEVRAATPEEIDHGHVHGHDEHHHH